MISHGLLAHVSGRVQGVSFRWFARRRAQQLKLCGYAMNLDDGRVEVLAFGTQENLTEFLKWLDTGSPMARVEEVVASDVNESSESFRDFSIY